MWLTDVAIRRPVFILMFVLALVVMGFQSRGKMPLELYPKVEFPMVTVVTTYPGAGPQEIETLVSEPIERAVSSVGNIKHVTSTSQDGVSMVGIEFELGTDINNASADVRDKVAAIRRELPRDLDQQTVGKVDITSLPVMTLGLMGSMSSKQMRILADDVIKDKLSQVGGVAGVYPSGGDIREVVVSVDRDRLQAYSASMLDVVNALQGANLNLPSGSIKEGTKEFAVRTVGEFSNAEEIGNIRLSLPTGKNGMPTVVRLGDVADVRDTIAEPDVLTRVNGKPAVVIAIQKQTDANTVDVANGIKHQLTLLTGATIQPSGFAKFMGRMFHKPVKPKVIPGILPAGVNIVTATDQSIQVEDALHDVNKSLFEGILLVVIIVFLFLHSARATFIVAIAIPTSIFATFLPMHSFGFGMNMMTMLALSLAVGILVDDSIVVLENIERHLRKGEPPKEAALNGRSEIGLAAITITMVDVVVFVPIAFMGGIVGQFFKQFGITIAAATLFSLIMSFTLTPMMASRWMNRAYVEEQDEEEAITRDGWRAGRRRGFWATIFHEMNVFYSGLDRQYRHLLVWALENRFLTIVIGFVSLLVVFAMLTDPVKAAPGPRLVIAIIAAGLSVIAFATSKAKGVALLFGAIMVYIALAIHFPFGGEMFPAVDSGDFGIAVELPPGSSLKATDAVVQQIEEELAKIKGMSYYVSTVGSSSTGNITGAGDSGSQYGHVSVKLVDKTERKMSVDDVVNYLTPKMALIPGATIQVSKDQGAGGHGNPIQMLVTGSDMDDIVSVSGKIEDAIKKVKGTVDVDTSWKVGKPEARVTVDRIRAAQMNLSVQQIAMALRDSIEGDTTSKLRESGTEYNIRVRLNGIDRQDVNDVASTIVGHSNGAPVYLRDVADVTMAAAPVKIDRRDRQRIVTVSANMATGYLLGNVQQAISKAVAGIPMRSTRLVTAGTSEMMFESFGYMISALILSILLVYMLMAALFESLVSPLIIMASLPQAMVGALLALLVTGYSMSIVTMIGIIMLTGLVTKNAILLVDYTNTLRERGKERNEAILESGPTRLRPIIMTTMAMVFGMLPTAVAASRGSEFRAPMAVAVIGGLIVSTLLTLIVIPVMYSIVDDWSTAFMRLIHWRTKREAVPAERDEREEIGAGREL